MLKFAALRPSQSPLFVLKFDLLLATCTSPTTLNSQASSLIYQNMRANALTDAELRRKAADELSCMTARINRGEAIPEPVKQLPVMGGRPLNRAQALAKIAEIKAKFGLKGARV